MSFITTEKTTQSAYYYYVRVSDYSSLINKLGFPLCGVFMFSECTYFLWEIAAICYLVQRFCKTDHKIKRDTLLHNSICKNKLSRQPVTLSTHSKTSIL